jgi:hypothetical protein
MNSKLIGDIMTIVSTVFVMCLFIIFVSGEHRAKVREKRLREYLDNLKKKEGE